jgi:hypothetical protein
LADETEVLCTTTVGQYGRSFEEYQMKTGMKLACAALAAVICAVCASRANAAATVNLISDTGSKDVVTGAYSSSASIASPYGTSITPPTIVPISGTSWQIDLVPTAQFSAFAFAQPTGQTTTMDGKLDIYVTFPSTIKLTVNVNEDGWWSTSGTGTVSATGGLVVTAVDSGTLAAIESHGQAFGSPTLNSNGSWSLFNKLDGTSFWGDAGYTTYKISIDNTLIAQALLPSPNANGTAFIAKKDFTLVLTSDGSSGGPNVPEPASLGVLALGGLALLARRRRA